MKKLLFCILTFGILIAIPTKAEIVLYCQDELATGFFKEGGEWRSGNFKPSRYTVKFNDEYSRAEGLSATPMECTISYPTQVPEVVFCVHVWGSHEVFVYNKKNKKFTFYTGGVASFITNGDDTLLLEAGTCESF